MELSAAVNCTYMQAPTTGQLLSDLTTNQLVILIVSALFVATTLICHCVFSIKFYHQHETSPQFCQHVIFIQTSYAVYSIISFVSLVTPRASILTELLFTVYISFVLKEFMNLMLRLLHLDDNYYYSMYGKVSLAAPPLACCCCCFCPKVPLNRTFFTFVKIGIYQAVVIRPVLVFVEAIILLNAHRSSGIEGESERIIDFVNGMSVLVAMYCSTLLYNGTSDMLAPHQIKVKYVCIQIVLLINGLQHAIISLLAKKGVIPCKDPFNSVLRAEDIHSFLVMAEMTILLLISFLVKKGDRRLESDPDPLLSEDGTTN